MDGATDRGGTRRGASGQRVPTGTVGTRGARTDDPASRAASAAGAERGVDGRFLTGNRVGPGNPYARQVAALRQEALNRCPPERYGQLVETYLRLAEEGDLEAAKFIFPYLVGKPKPASDPDRLDMEEFQGYRETANWMEEVPALLTRPSRWMPLNILREGQPAITQERGNQLGYILRTEGKEREKVQQWLSDPDKGLEKISQAMHRHQTGAQKKKKQRRR